MILPKANSPNNAPPRACESEVCGVLGPDDLCPYCRRRCDLSRQAARIIEDVGAADTIEHLVISALVRLLPALVEDAIDTLVARRIAEQLPAAVTVALEAELSARGQL